MKTIDLSANIPTLPELLQLAGSENVILRTPEGKAFVVAEVDDFAHEVSLVRKNDELMALLAERSRETTRFSAREVREMLDEP